MSTITQTLPNTGRQLLLLRIRPDVAFALIWGPVFYLYNFRISHVFLEPQWHVFAMVGRRKSQ